jgi:hypothetical protein
MTEILLRISRLAAVSLLALLSLSLTCTAENVPEPFTSGEMLTDDVMWSVFRAGEVRLLPARISLRIRGVSRGLGPLFRPLDGYGPRTLT